jgi:hypothetical protein
MSISIPRTEPLKRKPESPPREPPPKYPKVEEEEADPSSLFFTILERVTPEPGEILPSSSFIAKKLLQYPEILLPIQQTPIARIKEQFEVLLIVHEGVAQKTQVRIYQVLESLYHTSLINSSTQATLVQTANDFPKLKEKFNEGVKDQMKASLRYAEELLEDGKDCTTLQQIQCIVPKIDKMLRQLNDYRLLKHHLDPHENRRMLDLANLCVQQKTELQYPTIISDYPPLVKQIEQLSSELDLVSQAIKQLNDLNMHLQASQAKFLGHVEKAHPMQHRFLDAFSIPFYTVFAKRFQGLIWNSRSEPEVAEILKKIPSGGKTQTNQIDYLFINTVWEGYFPKYEFSQWILKVLESTDPKYLNTLEQKLQTISKKINAQMADPSLNNQLKSQARAALLEEVEMLCRLPTKPSYATLSELKKYLIS